MKQRTYIYCPHDMLVGEEHCLECEIMCLEAQLAAKTEECVAQDKRVKRLGDAIRYLRSPHEGDPRDLDVADDALAFCKQTDEEIAGKGGGE